MVFFVNLCDDNTGIIKYDSTFCLAILLIGYKLAKPKLFVSIFKLGWRQFLPFITTVLGIIATDLLVGIVLGLIVGVYFILVDSYKILMHSL